MRSCSRDKQRKRHLYWNRFGYRSIRMWNLRLGRAYAASGQTAKAAETLGNIYYTMPASTEADAAYAELKKLPSVPPPTVAQLKTRAEGLINRQRYADAADEYRSLVNESSPDDRPRMQLALADALHRSGQESGRQAGTRFAGQCEWRIECAAAVSFGPSRMDRERQRHVLPDGRRVATSRSGQSLAGTGATIGGQLASGASRVRPGPRRIP